MVGSNLVLRWFKARLFPIDTDTDPTEEGTMVLRQTQKEKGGGKPPDKKLRGAVRAGGQVAPRMADQKSRVGRSPNPTPAASKAQKWLDENR